MSVRVLRPAFCGLAFAVGVSLVGCRGGQPQEKAAMPPPAVTVARGVTVPVQAYFEYNGYLDAVEAVQVKARVKGQLKSVLFTEGSEVPSGKLLYEIDPAEYVVAVAKAKADKAKAVAELGKARSEEERAKEAYNKGVMSKEEFRQREAAREVSEATVTQAEKAIEAADIELGYTKITAPIGGQIGRTLVTPGNLVGQNETTLLTTILRTDELYVFFDIPEGDLLAYLREAEKFGPVNPSAKPIPFSIRLPNAGSSWYPGEIRYAEAAANPGTGTVRIRGTIKNPLRPGSDMREFLPGLYVHVRVPRGEPGPRLAIPEDALMTGQEGKFVYAVGPDNTVQKKLVEVGPTVWRTPPPGAGKPSPGWMLVNPKPPPAAPPGGEKGGDPKGSSSGSDSKSTKGGPPMMPRPSQMPVKSMVAIEKGIGPDDRVIVEGLQKARPMAPVNPEEWTLTPPGQPGKEKEPAAPKPDVKAATPPDAVGKK